MGFPALILVLAVILFIVGAVSLHWLLIAGVIALLVYLFVGPGRTPTAGSRRRWY